MVSPKGKLSHGSHATLPDLLCSGAEKTIGKVCDWEQDGNRVGRRKIVGRNQVNQTMGRNKSRKEILPEW